MLLNPTFNPGAFGNPITSQNYVFDTSLGTSGLWRAMLPSDFANILSGAELVVGSVGITGSPNVTVNGGFIGITGTPAVTAKTPVSAPTNFTISGAEGVMATGVAIVANASRVQSYIQNLGTGGLLYVKLGAAPASAQSFSFLLKAASASPGADGGTWSDNGFYQGAVSVSGTTRWIGWDA